jgi:hypothetical protein
MESQPGCARHHVTRNMDSTHISDVLRDFDRKKQSEQYNDSAASVREVVSSIGAETTLTVLVDIRSMFSDMLKEARTQTTIIEETRDAVLSGISETREINAQQHRETLAYLSKLSEPSAARQSVTPSPRLSSRLSLDSTSNEQVKYYYKGDELKTSQSIIGCLLLHIESLVSKELPSTSDVSDTTIMELRDWSTAATVLKEAHSTTTQTQGPLQFPKKGSEECTLVMETVANPIPGRGVTCKPEHIFELMSSCPTVMNCVEEVRLRALKCPGIISSSRLRNLSAISFPYVTDRDVLNIVNREPRQLGSAVLYDMVKQMKIPQRKAYANAVLRDSKKPVMAASSIKNEG